MRKVLTKRNCALALLGMAVMAAFFGWPNRRETIHVMVPRDSASRIFFEERLALRDHSIEPKIIYQRLSELESVRGLADGTLDFALLPVVPELFLAGDLASQLVLLDCAKALPAKAGGYLWLMAAKKAAGVSFSPGKTIALARPEASLERAVSDAIIRSRGGNPAGLRRLIMDPLEIRRAFSLGSLDLALLPEPLATLTERDGSARRIATSEGFAAGAAVLALVTSSRLAEKNPALVRLVRDTLRDLPVRKLPIVKKIDLGEPLSWSDDSLRDCAGPDNTRAALSAALVLFRKNGSFGAETPRLPTTY